MYWYAAGLDAGAFTTTVYSIASCCSSRSTTSATVEPFCPMATYTHFTAWSVPQ